MGEWSGKVAVVTGGATGIGQALARALAAEGMDLVLCSRNLAANEAAADRIRALGRRALAVACDVADRAQVRAMAARAEAELGPVELVCANAGATTFGELADHTDDDWDWSLDINLRGATNTIQAFYPAMVARRSGTIMLTGSQTALAPDWVLNHGPYIGAKAAVHALAFSLRAEAAAHGVNVSLLIPAGTLTDIAVTARPVPPGSGELRLPEGGPAPLPGFPFMLEPEEVAARAIAGLRRNAAVIPTHAALKPMVEHYFQRILAAYDDAATFTP